MSHNKLREFTSQDDARHLDQDAVKGEDDANMSKVDLAILRIAFILAAVDGHVDKNEYDCFETLAKHLPRYNVRQTKKALERAEHVAGYLELISRKGLPEDEFLACFMREIEHEISWTDFYWNKTVASRAFVLWIAMAMADRDYSSIERKAMTLLKDQVNWAMKRPHTLSSTVSLLAQFMGAKSMDRMDCETFEITDLYLKRVEALLLQLGRAAEDLTGAKTVTAKTKAQATYDKRLGDLKSYVETYSF